MSANKETVVVDANPLISALLGGRARIGLFSERFHLITTEFTIWEVKKFIPYISSKTDVSEKALLRNLERMPVTAFHPSQYDETRRRAEAIIGARDPKDVEIIALTLKMQSPIWSEDKDVKSLNECEVYSTADILKKAGVLDQK